MATVTVKLEGIGLFCRYPGSPSMIVRDRNVKSPWVAELSDICGKYGFKRKFLEPMVDYSESNSVKSRGVYYYYHLFCGRIYDVYEHLTWKKDGRYYCIVTPKGQLKHIDKDEAETILRSKRTQSS